MAHFFATGYRIGDGRSYTGILIPSVLCDCMNQIVWSSVPIHPNFPCFGGPGPPTPSGYATVPYAANDNVGIVLNQILGNGVFLSKYYDTVHVVVAYAYHCTHEDKRTLCRCHLSILIIVYLAKACLHKQCYCLFNLSSNHCLSCN